MTKRERVETVGEAPEPLNENALLTLLREEPCRLSAVLIALSWREGLSRHEIWALRWADVEFDALVLRVCEREVPMESEVAELLRRWRETTAPLTQSDYVAVKPKTHRHVAESALSQITRQALDEAGVGRITLQDLRADFICRMFAENDPAYAMRVTGISLSSYRNIYNKGMRQPKESVEERQQAATGSADRLWDVMQRNRRESGGIALWLTQVAGLSEKELLNLTWDQMDMTRGVLHLERGDIMLIKELMNVLSDERSTRTPADDPHVLLSRRKRKPMTASQLSAAVKELLIREGIGNYSIAEIRHGEKTESQLQRLRQEVRSKGGITQTKAAELLGVDRRTAAARLDEMIARGELVRSGRHYFPANEQNYNN